MKLRIRRHWVRAEHAPHANIVCTGLDGMLQRVAPGLILMFEERLDDASVLSALPGVLAKYALCAGRLHRVAAHLQIRCCDAGVPVSVVDSPQTFDQALQTLTSRDGWNLVDAIQPGPAASGKAPLLTLRITQFRDRGSCLGIGWHHSLGDMQSVKAFLESLGAATAGRPFEAPVVVNDRPAYLARHVPEVCSESTIRLMTLKDMLDLTRVVVESRNMQQQAYYFSSAEAQAMRAALQQEAGLPLTINDAITAHVFELITKADPRPRVRQLSVSINWRARLGLPSTLLGNLQSGMSIQCDPGRSAASIAREMRQRLLGFMERELNYTSNERFIGAHGGAVGMHRLIYSGADPGQGSFFMSSWKGFGLFDIALAGVVPISFGVVGRAIVPWGGLAEGFHSQGFMFCCYLPQKTAKALRTGTLQASMHRYRTRDEREPELVQRLPWVA